MGKYFFRFGKVLLSEILQDTLVRYPRLELARQLADALEGRNPFGDAPNGLFLAAPRRTGKSTFLQADLKPELERRGVKVIYVDFWSDLDRDPVEALTKSLASAVVPHLGPFSKLAAKTGLARFAIRGVEFDLSRIGRPNGATITETLQTLQATVRAPVALILDEAQHVLASETGEAVMMNLKSARDQMNRPGIVQLMLVMSGSDRDKLLRLVNTAAAPFYGSQITRMPTLGRDFVAHVAELVEKQRPELAPLDRALLFDAFEALGSRPQFFMDALGRVLSPFFDGPSRPEAAALEIARGHENDEYSRMESDFLSMRPLERAVLWRMLDQGPRFRAFDSESKRFYSDTIGRGITKTQVQTALEGLRNRSPPMVWKSARGEYAVDDSAMHAWFKARVEAGAWPPSDGTRLAGSGSAGSVQLTLEDQQRFAEALLSPSPPTPAMTRALTRRRKLLREE